MNNIEGIAKSNVTKDAGEAEVLESLTEKSTPTHEDTREILETSTSIDKTFQFQFSSSLFAIGLFVLQENNLEEIVKNVEPDPDSSTYAKNPVYFAPNVNHHPCTYERMDQDFKASAYRGGSSEFHHRDIHVLAYQICEGEPGNETHDTLLQSLYVVEYMKKNSKWVNREIIHRTKYARGIPANFYKKFKDTFNCKSSMDFVRTIFAKLSNKRIEKISDVKAIAKEFALDDVEHQSYKDVHEAYSDIRYKFQKKFRIGIGILEGNHRINLAIRLICNQLPTNAYLVDKEEQREKRIRDINLKKSNFNKMFKINVYVPRVAIPRIDELKVKSSDILTAQQDGFATSLGDVLLECSKAYENIMYRLKSNDLNAAKDITVDSYYNKNFVDPKFKFRGETDGEEFITFLKDFSDSPSGAVSNPFFRKSGIVLPELFPHLMKYSHFASNQIRLNTSKGDLSFANTKLWILYGSMKVTPMVSAHELEKLNPASNKSTPIVYLVVRGVLEFLRALLFTEDGRNLLASYICLSSRGQKKWPQKVENGSFNYSRLHDENIVRFIMVCSMKITSKICTLFDKKKVKKRQLTFILFQVFVKQILRDVLRIGQNPLVDKLRLQHKVGKSYKQYFFPNAKESFLVCALRYYSEYVEKYITTAHLCDTEFHLLIIDKKSQELELDMESLNFSKKKIPMSTMDRVGHVQVEKDTTIPGSFYEFFVALAGKIPNNKQDVYEKFFFTDPVGKKRVIKKITPKPKQQQKPQRDMFSSLQEFATSMLDDASTGRKDLNLNEFVEKSLSAITEATKDNSPTLTKYISFIIDTVNETVGGANQITMSLDESKLKQVFQQTGNDDDNASSESEAQEDAASTEPEVAAV